MKLKVVSEKFGKYAKGDIIEKPDSTAKALIAHGVVEEVKEKESKTKKEEK